MERKEIVIEKKGDKLGNQKASLIECDIASLDVTCRSHIPSGHLVHSPLVPPCRFCRLIIFLKIQLNSSYFFKIYCCHHLQQEKKQEKVYKIWRCIVLLTSLFFFFDFVATAVATVVANLLLFVLWVSLITRVGK